MEIYVQNSKIGGTNIVHKLKWLAIVSVISVGVICLLAYGISRFYDFSLSDTTFVIGLLVLISGLYFSMQGRAFGNRFMPNSQYNAAEASLEAEREIREMTSQGSLKYAMENRILIFRFKPFVMIISGLISLLIAYLVS